MAHQMRPANAGENGFELHSTVEGSTMLSQVPADFGNPGAYRLMARPGQESDSADHRRIFDGMLAKQVVPLSDVKVLKGTAYSYKNRRIITKWLRDVCDAFKHKTTTLNLATQLTDMFLFFNREKYPVNRCQLVALGAIWISAKFEETDRMVPSLDALTDVCAKAYRREDILDIEEELLGFVNFAVPHTTGINFMHLFMHCVPSIAARDGGIEELTVPRGAEPPRPAAPPAGTVGVLYADRGTSSGGLQIKQLTGVQPSALLASLAPHVATVSGAAPSAQLTLYLVVDTPIRVCKPVGNITCGEAAQLCATAGCRYPLLYARGANQSAGVFAEDAGWLLLRAPNETVLRVSEAALREALINVEFLKVEQSVLGLAALAFAVTACTADSAASAATVMAIQERIARKSWDHFRSAVQLIGEKYVEAVRGASASSAAGGSGALPLPVDVVTKVDQFLQLAAPRAGGATTVVPAATAAAPLRPSSGSARQCDFDGL